MSEPTAHSADVQMILIFNGSVFPITHMGPDFVRLGVAVEHPPGVGEIVLTIDGHESRWNVVLPAGLRADVRIPVQGEDRGLSVVGDFRTIEG